MRREGAQESLSDVTGLKRACDENALLERLSLCDENKEREYFSLFESVEVE
jgi:hypothetical protein